MGKCICDIEEEVRCCMANCEIKPRKKRKKRGPNKPKVPIAQTDGVVSLDFAYKQIAISRKGLDAANKRIKELEEKLNKFENPPNNIDY